MPCTTGMLGTMLGPAVIINWSAPITRHRTSEYKNRLLAVCLFSWGQSSNRDCHRHQFFKFPDFSLRKAKVPWPNKCKISDMVAASNLWLQESFPPIWPKMFLPTFDGIKSVLQFQFFPDFSSKCQFSLTQNKIPWPFPDLWQPW